MPELPEVEHVKNGLVHLVTGRSINDVAFSGAVQLGKLNGKETIIKGTSLEDFTDRLKGMVISNLIRRSKYLIFDLIDETDDTNSEHLYLVTHLGMTGAYFVHEDVTHIPVPNYAKHWHVAMTMDNQLKLIYSDIRRFGEMRLMNAVQFSQFDQNIAPEPFSEAAREHFLKALKNGKYDHQTIKEVIMNHQLVSGCGNIYACEALHLARINPNRKVRSVSGARRSLLFIKIQDVLNEGIQYGGSTISDYRNVEGLSGTMQNRFKVYGRKICGTCGSPVKQKVIKTRNTHYCTNCQK